MHMKLRANKVKQEFEFVKQTNGVGGQNVKRLPMVLLKRISKEKWISSAIIVRGCNHAERAW